MPALYPLFYSNLQDNIPSVRQGAALAIANVAQVYGKKKIIKGFFKVGNGVTSSRIFFPSSQMTPNFLIILHIMESMKMTIEFHWVDKSINCSFTLYM